MYVQVFQAMYFSQAFPRTSTFDASLFICSFLLYQMTYLHISEHMASNEKGITI